jgi:hypothetical protein
MNKSVQILILLVLLPLAGVAQEETLEERKQRIVRKYLRERVTISQSEMVVPTDFQEDERVTDSEKFKTPEVDLARQDASPAQAVTPPPQPRPVPRADENWLLKGTDETTEFDQYGNPIDASIEGADYWSGWGGTDKEREEKRSSSRRYDPYAREDRGAPDSRLQQGPQNRGFGAASFSEERADLFGNRQTSPAPASGFSVQRTPRSFGSSPDGMLMSPFGQNQAPEEEQAPEFRTYQPYKSPYQQQREQRSQSPSFPKPSTQQEYKRPDSYEQWKSRQKQYDPTSDDAYINEMMKQNRR